MNLFITSNKCLSALCIGIWSNVFLFRQRLCHFAVAKQFVDLSA